MPTNTITARSITMVSGLNIDPKLIYFPDRELNMGRKAAINPMLSSRAKTAVSVDSIRNWDTSCNLEEPVTFLIPISFALLADLAVVRFI